MIMRALDTNGDWTFGRGKNNFKSGRDAVIQSINTRLKSLTGDCFFAIYDHIDWLNLLGSKDTLGIQLAVSSVILNTQNVTRIVSLNVALDADRQMTISYTVDIQVPSVVVTTTQVTGSVSYLLNEDGSFILTEDGGKIIL